MAKPKNERLEEFLRAVRASVNGMPAIMQGEPRDEWLKRLRVAADRMRETDPLTWAVGSATYAFMASQSPDDAEGAAAVAGAGGLE